MTNDESSARVERVPTIAEQQGCEHLRWFVAGENADILLCDQCGATRPRGAAEVPSNVSRPGALEEPVTTGASGSIPQGNQGSTPSPDSPPVVLTQSRAELTELRRKCREHPAGPSDDIAVPMTMGDDAKFRCACCAQLRQLGTRWVGSIYCVECWTLTEPREDIVARLRKSMAGFDICLPGAAMASEAANEIERLRALVPGWQCPACLKPWATDGAHQDCPPPVLASAPKRREIDWYAKVPVENRFTIDMCSGKLIQDQDGPWVLRTMVDNALQFAREDAEPKGPVLPITTDAAGHLVIPTTKEPRG